MKRFRNVVIFCFGMVILFGACFNLKQPRNKVDFYTLEYDPPRLTNLESLPLVLKIDRFSVAPILNTGQIVYQDRSFKRDSYVYHRWRVNPGDLVTYFLGRDLRESGLFKAVLPDESGAPSSYLVEGTLEDFFERDTEEAWEAVLALSITLMAEREPDISKKIIFQRTYRAKEACKQKNPKALAVAMSQAMAKVSGEIIKDIYGFLKDRK
ncbi:MAG: ABC-type transport auxiliary lipoprotein family protein [Pseudomonadota bacterium]